MFRLQVYTVFSGSKNSTKEKEKLANIMAFGQDIDPQAERAKRAQQQREEYVEEPEVDRFDECKAA